MGEITTLSGVGVGVCKEEPGIVFQHPRESLTADLVGWLVLHNVTGGGKEGGSGVAVTELNRPTNRKGTPLLNRGNG